MVGDKFSSSSELVVGVVAAVEASDGRAIGADVKKLLTSLEGGLYEDSGRCLIETIIGALVGTNVGTLLLLLLLLDSCALAILCTDGVVMRQATANNNNVVVQLHGCTSV